jgi:hypothetical protein
LQVRPAGSTFSENLFAGDAPLVYRHLDENQILHTLRTLGQRIEERFPGSGLARVGTELLAVGEETRRNVAFIRKPYWLVRIAAIVCIIIILALFASAFATVVSLVQAERAEAGLGSAAEVIQAIESLVQEAVFLGIAIWFFLSLEARFKRRRAHNAIHELRSIAHIVDMHQLTKDPERMFSTEPDTASSPERNMNREQLGRYLDYCSELLSLASKLAALYVQYRNDPVVLEAVSEVEQLSGSLSNKVWQKITLLDSPRAGSGPWLDAQDPTR